MRRDLLVLRRCAQEGLEGRRERVVGVVHEDVALFDRVEERLGRRRDERRRRAAEPRLVLEIRTLDGSELAEVGEIEQPLDARDLRLVHPEPVLQPLDHPGGHRLGDLETNRLAEPAAAKLELDGLEKVVGLV